jgi:hypothetical protein
MLFEDYTQHLSSINLTDHQKMVLAKAVEAGAIDEPARVLLADAKFIAARDILDELDIIEYTHETDLISITQTGINIMQQNNIIDESNQLTEDGKAYAEDKVPDEKTPTVEQHTFKEFLNLS